MMDAKTMYISRIRLRKDVPASALRAVLMPQGISERLAAAHRLMWTLFPLDRSAERDFLWREAGDGEFYCLSAREPSDSHGLFEIDAPKIFSPALAKGDRLRFSLRANATVARGGHPATSGSAAKRGKPCDIVMDALRSLDRHLRAQERTRVLVPVARDWLSRQGERHGFVLETRNGRSVDEELPLPLSVSSYRVLRIDRGRGREPLRAGVLDLEGELTVTDPAALTEAISRGFGRSKAFGCGLMLIQRCHV